MAESLGAALLTIGVDLDSFNAGLNQAQQLAAKAGNDISKKLDARRATLSALQQQLNTLESKLKSNPWSAAALEAPIKALQSEIGLRKQSIALLEKQIGLSNSQQTRNAGGSGAGSELVSGAIGAVPGIGGLASLGPAAVGAGVAAAAVAAVKAANDFQKLNQQLNLLTGSSIDTQNALIELKDYAAKTPFDLPGVAENAKLLLAFGLSTQQAVEFTKRLGDVATVTGTPLDRLALNLGQIVSQGKAYTVDLRQFALAGVPIYEALAKATGKNVSELKELGGAIPAKDVVKAFEIMTDAGGKFYQGGEKGGTKLDASLATLNESLTLLGVSVGKVLGPTVLEAIGGATGLINQFGSRLEEISKIGEIPVLKQFAEFANKFGATFALKLVTGGYAFDLADAAQGATGGQPKPVTKPPAFDPASVAKQQQKAAEAAAAAARQAAKDIAEANDKIVAPAAERLRIMQATINLAGNDLEIAQKAFDLESARKDEVKARQDYAKALSDASGNKNDKNVINAAAKLQAAGIAVQESLIRGSKALSDATADTTLFEKQTQIAIQGLNQRIAKAKELAAIEDQGQRGAVAAADAVVQSINEAARRQQEISLQLQNQAAKGASTEEIRSTLAASVQAGQEVELALINGGRALADQLKAAGDRLTDALTGNFNILNEQGRQIVLDQAQGNITRGIQTGLVDITKIPGRNDAASFIQFGQQSKAIADAFENNAVTQKAVAAAQAELAAGLKTATTGIQSSFNGLTEAIPTLVAALNSNANADRSITVTVNADTGQTYIQQATALQ